MDNNQQFWNFLSKNHREIPWFQNIGHEIKWCPQVVFRKWVISLGHDTNWFLIIFNISACRILINCDTHLAQINRAFGGKLFVRML
ncbi:MAG: hypothetical protein C0490_16410 [Marivirga sp.]|nr:hypothetical protein [Marivirga sp.]